MLVVLGPLWSSLPDAVQFVGCLVAGVLYEVAQSCTVSDTKLFPLLIFGLDICHLGSY